MDEEVLGSAQTRPSAGSGSWQPLALCTVSHLKTPTQLFPKSRIGISSVLRSQNFVGIKIWFFNPFLCRVTKLEGTGVGI